MNRLSLLKGSQATMTTDVRYAADEAYGDDNELLWIVEEDLRTKITDEASALFPKPHVVLVIVQPDWKVVDELAGHIRTILERTGVIIHTSADPPPSFAIEHTLTVIREGKTFAEKEKIREDRLRQVVLRIARRHGKQMTDKAFALFQTRIHDESTVGLELEKLISYVGKRERIDSKDIQAVISDSHEDRLYTLFEAFAAKDRKKTAALLDALLKSGMHILAVQGYLLRQVRLLLHAKDLAPGGPPLPYGIFQKILPSAREDLDPKPRERKNYLTYQKPYPAFKLYQVSQKISSSDLIELYLHLADVDKAIKTGAANDRVLIERTLLAP